jgi:hypothetical protein
MKAYVVKLGDRKPNWRSQSLHRKRMCRLLIGFRTGIYNNASLRGASLGNRQILYCELLYGMFVAVH